MILTGGVSKYKYFALVMAWIFSFYLIYQVVSMGIYVNSVESLSEFEGPNGEGSPIAPLVGIAFYSSIFLLPSLIASLRGLLIVLPKNKNTEQDAAHNH